MANTNQNQNQDREQNRNGAQGSSQQNKQGQNQAGFKSDPARAAEAGRKSGESQSGSRE